MKKYLGLFLGMMLLCVVFLTGCGKNYETNDSTIFILKNGSVVCTDVEEFDEGIYRIEDLESYVNDQIAEYTAQYGEDSVKLESVKVEESIAKLVIKYASCEDFTRFTGIDLYVGSVAEALASGYSFSGNNYVAVDGTETSAANSSDFVNSDNYKVAIVNAPYQVNVYGAIQYVSTKNTAIVDKNTVDIAFGNMIAGFETVEEPEEQIDEDFSVDSEDGVITEEVESDGVVGEDEFEMSTEEVMVEFVFDDETDSAYESVNTSVGYVYIIFK